MLDIRFDPLADEDLDFIFDHYAVKRQAPLAAIDINEAINASIRYVLAAQPELGWPCKIQDFEGRAFLVERSHYIFYQVYDDHILIGRIIAAKLIRDWRSLRLSSIQRS